MECPENTVVFVDELVIPNTITTIQSNVNDKLYFAVFYNGVVLYKILLSRTKLYDNVFCRSIKHFNAFWIKQ